METVAFFIYPAIKTRIALYHSSKLSNIKPKINSGYGPNVTY